MFQIPEKKVFSENGVKTYSLVELVKGSPTIMVDKGPDDTVFAFPLVALIEALLGLGLVVLLLLMSLAERADLIVDFTNVQLGNYVLRNLGPDQPYSGGEPPGDFEEADPDTTGQILEFRVVPAIAADPSTPPRFLTLPALSPALFSFNAPSGMCPDCNGLGSKMQVDPNLIVEHPNLSLLDGASRWYGPMRKKKGWQLNHVSQIAKHYGIDVEEENWHQLGKKPHTKNPAHEK